MNRITFKAAFFVTRIIALCLFLVVSASIVHAAGPVQRDFATPEEAASALVDAARANDQKALLAILGRSAKNLISSGDSVQDQNVRTRFASSYDAKHAVQRQGDSRAALVVGENDWPLPIPIVQSGGRWSFDSTAGADELVNRRIGKNELLTIRTLLAGVEAQKDYFARHKEGTGTGAYAQRILSTPGQTDGLYWDVDGGQPPSPLGPLVDQARDEGYPGAETPGGKQLPYHGYFFRILKAQGANAAGGVKDYVRKGLMTDGFALIAWPAEYGNSGIMTFLIDQDGTLFQKDLGPKTARAAAAITLFDQDLSWAAVNISAE